MHRSATSRKEMIGQLVEHSVIRAISEPQHYWLREIFEKGVVGYNKFSDQQLRLEMQLRGLAPSGEAFDDEANDEADDEFSFSHALI